MVIEYFGDNCHRTDTVSQYKKWMTLKFYYQNIEVFFFINLTEVSLNILVTKLFHQRRDTTLVSN